MSFYEKYRHPSPLSDLPIWRRVLFFAAIGFSVLLAAVGVDKHLTIYGTAPDHPVPEKEQIYSVDVMHGYIRYVTASEKESFDLWAGRSGSWAGAAMTGAFLIWVTYRKAKSSSVR
jgi:hypothetical protein